MAARKKQAEKVNKLSLTNKADSVETTSCDGEGSNICGSSYDENDDMIWSYDDHIISYKENEANVLLVATMQTLLPYFFWSAQHISSWT